ncbi:hypothetical protein [Butyrivibrio sp.]|uniref:hypothetical protein n=1 Tax=Butyrivibrio sp. TaxID=28121 RepID=UPI0025BE9543|nr:hypothetical protein [Butyrivibrio sp.]
MSKKMRLFLCLLITTVLMLSGCGSSATVLDFGDAESFEAALNAGENLEGKTVRFYAAELHPDSAMGYNVWAGEHLNFISARNPDIKAGDTVDVKATEITSSLGSWFIKYEKISDGTIGESTIVGAGPSTTETNLVEEIASPDTQDTEEKNAITQSEPEKPEESGQSAEEVSKQLDIHGEMTMDGQAVVFVTNNSKTIIDELEVQVNYLDASGNTIDMDSDGHDMILPGYTVVSKMDVPSSGFDSSEIEYKMSLGDHPSYVNHSEDIAIESNPGSDCVIVKITNNSDVTIDEIEYDVVLYKGEDIVTITYPEDVYDVLPGSTETEKVSVYNVKTYDNLVYGTDYDRIEVFLNQAHTFGY